MELKTLQQIIEANTSPHPVQLSELNFLKELKQEVIKHIKHFSKPRVIERWTITKWIKHFFNITEKDLK